MSMDKWLVLAAGIAAIAWVLWCFLVAGRVRAEAAATPGGVQEVRVVVEGGYVPDEVVVAAGRPVRLLFDRRETGSCSEEVVLPDFKIRKFLPAHETTPVEFTPTSP